MEKAQKNGRTVLLKDLGKVAVVLGTCAAVFTGAAIAYFTANGTAENTFTVYGGAGGETLAIEVQEPDWDESADHTVLPGTEVKKNPLVTNTEGVEAYAFLKVSVPLGTVGGIADSPLFALNGLNTGPETEQWTSEGSWTEDGSRHEVFSYNGTIAKDQSTSPLFTSVTFSPELTGSEAKALAQDVSINVDAFSVQKANIADSDAALALSGWMRGN